MSQFVLLFIPKRKLLTDVQVNRLSVIFLELGKFAFAGFVIGRFIPGANIPDIRFWFGLISACVCFLVSVLLTRKT